MGTDPLTSPQTDAPAPVAEEPADEANLVEPRAAEDATASTAPARSPAIAAVLSFVFPGAGQLYLGRRISAIVFAVPALVVVIWAAIQLSQGGAYFVASLLDDGYALTVMVVVAVFTLWHIASIAHPYLVVRPTRFSMRAGSVLAVLLIATLGMGDVVFSNAFDAYNFDHQITSNSLADATDPPTPSPVVSATGPDASATDTGSPLPTDSPNLSPTPAPTCPPSYMAAPQAGLSGFAYAVAQIASGAVGSAATSSTPVLTPFLLTAVPNSSSAAGTGSPQPSTTSAPSPSPSPSPSPRWGPDTNPNRLTILLVGVDFMQGRSHALTDTLLLVSVDLRSRAVAMVSVPRDTAAFPFYWGGRAPSNFKINGLVNAISAGRFGSPDRPLVTLANEIGWLVGVRVDYYAEIDMDGFSQLVDMVGGVDIYNPVLLNDPSTCTYVPAGNVHFNGPMALKYVRSRESTNDYQRANRQQIVLMALRKKLATPAMLPQLGNLLALAGKSITTNFPIKTTKNYVAVAEHISSISNCVLGPPYNYHPDSSLTGGMWTSQLDLGQVAGLSVRLFGTDSRYYGQPGVVPASCRNHG